jgi:hypothetical protein
MLLLAGCNTYTPPATTTTNPNPDTNTSPSISGTPEENLNGNLNTGNQTNGQNTTSQPSETTNNGQTTPKLQTFQSSKYKFQFQYPQEFALTTARYGNLNDKVIQVEMSSDNYPNTNFNDAGFAVTASPAQSQNQCLTASKPEGSSDFSNTTTINGIKFYWTNGTGAGAGNLYDSKIYRTYNKNTCLEISETVHTSNLGNYTPGTVQEVNKDPIWQKLDGILQTFKFTS